MNLLAPEGAQPASGYTDVRGIDMAINIEICLIPMQALANVIGHPAEGEHIATAIKGESISKIEAIASDYFGVNRLQPAIVSLKGMLARGGHLLDDIAG